MKKKIFYLAFIFLAISCLSSCEGLLGDACKICSLNTYENGVKVSSVNEAEYCDNELLTIQAIPQEDLGGGLIARWECYQDILRFQYRTPINVTSSTWGLSPFHTSNISISFSPCFIIGSGEYSRSFSLRFFTINFFCFGPPN